MLFPVTQAQVQAPHANQALIGIPTSDGFANLLDVYRDVGELGVDLSRNTNLLLSGRTLDRDSEMVMSEEVNQYSPGVMTLIDQWMPRITADKDLGSRLAERVSSSLLTHASRLLDQSVGQSRSIVYMYGSNGDQMNPARLVPSQEYYKTAFEKLWAGWANSEFADILGPKVTFGYDNSTEGANTLAWLASASLPGGLLERVCGHLRLAPFPLRYAETLGHTSDWIADMFDSPRRYLNATKQPDITRLGGWAWVPDAAAVTDHVLVTAQGETIAVKLWELNCMAKLACYLSNGFETYKVTLSDILELHSLLMAMALETVARALMSGGLAREIMANDFANDANRGTLTITEATSILKNFRGLVSAAYGDAFEAACLGNLGLLLAPNHLDDAANDWMLRYKSGPVAHLADTLRTLPSFDTWDCLRHLRGFYLKMGGEKDYMPDFTVMEGSDALATVSVLPDYYIPFTRKARGEMLTELDENDHVAIRAGSILASAPLDVLSVLYEDTGSLRLATSYMSIDWPAARMATGTSLVASPSKIGVGKGGFMLTDLRMQVEPAASTFSSPVSRVIVTHHLMSSRIEYRHAVNFNRPEITVEPTGVHLMSKQRQDFVMIPKSPGENYVDIVPNPTQLVDTGDFDQQPHHPASDVSNFGALVRLAPVQRGANLGRIIRLLLDANRGQGLASTSPSAYNAKSIAIHRSKGVTSFLTEVEKALLTAKFCTADELTDAAKEADDNPLGTLKALAELISKSRPLEPGYAAVMHIVGDKITGEPGLTQDMVAYGKKPTAVAQAAWSTQWNTFDHAKLVLIMAEGSAISQVGVGKPASSAQFYWVHIGQAKLLTNSQDFGAIGNLVGRFVGLRSTAGRESMPVLHFFRNWRYVRSMTCVSVYSMENSPEGSEPGWLTGVWQHGHAVRSTLLGWRKGADNVAKALSRLN